MRSAEIFIIYLKKKYSTIPFYGASTCSVDIHKMQKTRKIYTFIYNNSFDCQYMSGLSLKILFAMFSIYFRNFNGCQCQILNKPNFILCRLR